MSLAWYVRRLKSMSPGEVLHRVHELALKVSARTLTEGLGAVCVRRRCAGHPRAAAGSDVCIGRSARRRQRSARRHIDGRFSALGRDWPRRLPGVPISPDLWRLDPVTGRLWPGADAFTFDIQYRHERRFGDIKYVWEFNRLQFLQPLAADVALTGNPRAVTLIEDVIASWYEANPPFRGVGWNSGIECALRAISVLVASSLAGDRFSADTVRRVRAMLAAHAFWIARFPSRFLRPTITWSRKPQGRCCCRWRCRIFRMQPRRKPSRARCSCGKRIYRSTPTGHPPSNRPPTARSPLSFCSSPHSPPKRHGHRYRSP